MLRSYRKLQGTRTRALDGEIGSLKDIYIDDSSWAVQYFVVELGSWFNGKDVLVPPDAVAPFDGTTINIELTKAEIRSCKHADSAIPVSLQQRYRERSLFNFACTIASIMNAGPMIVPPVSGNSYDTSEIDPHLRSCRTISKYHLINKNTEVGIMEDLLLDDSYWHIRFTVATVGKADSSIKKLFKPQLIDNIDCSLSTISLSIGKSGILAFPDFFAEKHLDTSYEMVSKDLIKAELLKY